MGFHLKQSLCLSLRSVLPKSLGTEPQMCSEWVLKVLAPRCPLFSTFQLIKPGLEVQLNLHILEEKKLSSLPHGYGPLFGIFRMHSFIYLFTHSANDIEAQWHASSTEEYSIALSPVSCSQLGVKQVNTMQCVERLSQMEWYSKQNKTSLGIPDEVASPTHNKWTV